jgi:hypothetical protein
MIAIITKVLAATDRRGARIVATAPLYAPSRARLVTGWDYSLNPAENHENAALNFWGTYGDAGHKFVGSADTSTSTRAHLFDRP